MENQNDDKMFKYIKETNEVFSSLESLVKSTEGINIKAMSPIQKQILSMLLTDMAKGIAVFAANPDRITSSTGFVRAAINASKIAGNPCSKSHPSIATNEETSCRLEVQKQQQSTQPEQELPDTESKAPCFTPPTPNPIPQPIFNPYGSHPSQQFNQQPSFAPYTPNPIPQQPYGPHPSFGPTPYPPQQPYGQDITLMRIMEQLYSLSEKVDLLLRKQ